MNTNSFFTSDEAHILRTTAKELLHLLRQHITHADYRHIRMLLHMGVEQGCYARDRHGINQVVRLMTTAQLFASMIAPDRTITIATLLYPLCKDSPSNIRRVEELFGADATQIIHGMDKIGNLYRKQAAVRDENFHKLLLTLASDIRVILIMIVDRMGLLRAINHHPDEVFVSEVSHEARYLYAPLAHRLGLYQIKSDLEDLSLKYLNRRVYNQIAQKLNETKQRRELYIKEFIRPVKEALQQAGLRFTVKGRTKSINSIWNKMQNKQVDLNGMYDLFAIRIIIDTPAETEKRDCWVAYSIVTDIYTANVSRLKDWITIPKSNGYESLHITVHGPDNKWVEVQIRTRRMDEVAERGLAAHWRYKGLKSEGDADRWMNNVREVLEAGHDGHLDLVKDMRMNLYAKEVFVFTPRGDLFKLPQGATLLDFAFSIHSGVGASCIGGLVDGKNQKLNYKLRNGDTVEILTSSTQIPRLDWLHWVVTSKAKAKIRQALNEARAKKVELARESLQRKFRNRKVDYDEGPFTRMVTKIGYKNLSDFYVAIQDGKFDAAEVVDRYVAYIEKLNEANTVPAQTAEDFVLQHDAELGEANSADILVIGDDIRGINYKLAKCCNPVYGDAITGFVSADGAIKIHKSDCGNICHLQHKYPYRIIRSRWSGKLGHQFAATIKVVGRDDIGIVTNITSLINKEGNTHLHNISINSSDGEFEGYLVIGVPSVESLDQLIKKIKNLKGVKDVIRTSH